MSSKFFLGAIAFGLLSLGVRAQTTTIPNNTTYGAGSPPVVVSGPTDVTTGTSTVLVSSGATVTYVASNSVKLEPGFHASAGSKFYVMIGSNVDSDSNGLPDVWERANGLVVGTINSGNTAPNGLSYLKNYQLGLNPAGTSPQSDTGNTTLLKINRPI